MRACAKHLRIWTTRWRRCRMRFCVRGVTELSALSEQAALAERTGRGDPGPGRGRVPGSRPLAREVKRRSCRSSTLLTKRSAARRSNR